MLWQRMQITTNKAAARGVSQLMYVGDAEPATVLSTPVKVAIAAAALWFLFGRK